MGDVVTNEAMYEGGPAWQITSQLEQTGQDANGRYVEGVKVSFTTAAGLMGSVFVPNTLYNAASVRQLVAQRVAQMSEVHGLNG